jgi:CheY-like chemotaxis protein
MPILDGYDATKQIRNYLHSKGLPQLIIIAITGHIEDSYVQKAYASGMNGVS